MADGGYRRAELWLSAGWDAVKANGWRAPLYWTEKDGAWSVFTLRGEQPLERLKAAPVSQISFYEADAYARWAGHRLPTEFEWEAAVEGQTVEGNLLDSGRLMTASTELIQNENGAKHWYGDCWVWTSSGRAGRIQRQVHERADGSAGRIVRDAGTTHPRELPQLLCARDEVAVFRHKAGVLSAPGASNGRADEHSFPCPST